MRSYFGERISLTTDLAGRICRLRSEPFGDVWMEHGYTWFEGVNPQLLQGLPEWNEGIIRETSLEQGSDV